MKLVYTFLMVTIALGFILHLSGALPENNNTAITTIMDLVKGNDVASSQLWTQLLIFAGAIALAAGANALTGGSSGVAVTIGKGLASTWLINFAADYISLISAVDVHDATGALLPSATSIDVVVYYIILVFGGLLAIGFIYSLFDLLIDND